MLLERKTNILTSPPVLAPADSKIIEIRDLAVRYTIGSRRNDVKSRFVDAMLGRGATESVWALKDITLSCHCGEIVGIIGANGAGKTTLCRVLAGLLEPDQGVAEIRGTVSALFSLGTGFRQQLSGRENIFLNGMMLGFSRRRMEAISRQIIEFSGLVRFIDTPIKYYSSGMKARLGFSIAAMLEPDILVLDEALSTGDLHFSQKAGARLKEIIEKSRLVMVVTHKMDFVRDYCSRAIWLDHGAIRADGSPEDVTDAYAAEVKPPAVATRKKPRLRATQSAAGPQKLVSVQDIGVRFALNHSVPRESEKDAASERCNPSFLDHHRREILWALKDVGFDVMEGEILGIIGPNGAGKSTLCKVLCEILKPDLGKVSVQGEIAALLTFGAGFKLELSGKDNIYLNGLLLGVRKRKIDLLMPEIISFSGISEKFIDQPVKYYSKGMRARLGFSAASVIKPDIFIIDEALNAGDLDFYAKASAKIQEIITGSRATIVVTHNIQFVKKVCTRAILLDKGRKVFDGDPRTAVAMYRQLVS